MKSKLPKIIFSAFLTITLVVPILGNVNSNVGLNGHGMTNINTEDPAEMR